MIKKLFICAIPVLAMTACTSEEDVKAPVNTNQEISFSAVNHVMSRNALVNNDADNGTFNTGNVMYVSALYNDNTTTPATKEVYFENQLFKHNGTVWAAYDKAADGGNGAFSPIYYPYSGTLKFMAYSTAKTPSASWSYNDKSTFDKLVLTFGNTLDGAEDVLYSSEVVEQEAAEANGAKAFTFNHALALVSFKVQLATGITASIEVNSITVNDAYLSGTLTVQKPATAWTASWTDASNQASMVVPDATAVTLVPNADAVPFGTGVLVVDQTPTSFTVNYDMTVSGTKYQGLTKTVDFAKGSISEWKAGNKYTYTVILSPKQVTFTGSVNKWGDGGEEQETL